MPDNAYYSADGNLISLEPSPDTVAIAYQEDMPEKDLEKLIRGDDQLAQFITSPDLQERRIVLYKRGANARRSLADFADRVTQSQAISYVKKVYYRGNTPLVLTDEFIAAFKPEVSRQTISELNDTHNVEIVEEFDFVPNTFLLRVRSPEAQNTLEIANLYFESGLVRYAEPSFIYTMERKSPLTPNDPLFPQQWHLPRIQAPRAWDITQGAPANIVAIIDDGIDLDHEDLSGAGRIVAGRDVLSGDNDPRPAGANDNHGTAVAGVAIANGNNGIGVSGISPNCRLMPIRLVGTGQTNAREVAAFRFAADNGAAIISNSWGPTDGAGAAPLPGIVRDAINHATDNGREGRGCVIFFAAGNGNESISSPGTLDGYASYERVIAVAACNDQDVRSGYSDFGPEVNICAPSDGTSAFPQFWPGMPPDGSTLGIFTTDRMGNAGYNPPPPPTVDPAGAAINYTGSFGGTSSACPLAAGVAALMLSINPNLTWQQVRYILEATADKIDDANTDPVGRYKPQGNPQEGHSDWYGYGRVNALNAVRGARSSVPERDFIQRVQVTLRRTSGDRFVSTKVLHAIDARARREETADTIFVRGGPDGFLRAEFVGLSDEVDVDPATP